MEQTVRAFRNLDAVMRSLEVSEGELAERADVDARTIKHLAIGAPALLATLDRVCGAVKDIEEQRRASGLMTKVPKLKTERADLFF